MLLSPNAHLNDGVFEFVVSFSLKPVFVITVLIFRYSTKKLLNLLCIVYIDSIYFLIFIFEKQKQMTMSKSFYLHNMR